MDKDELVARLLMEEIRLRTEQDYYYSFCRDYAHWIMGDVKAWLNDNKLKIEESKLKPEELRNLVLLIKNGVISGKIAKSVLPEMMKGVPVLDILTKTGKTKITDEAQIGAVVKEVIESHPEIVADYKKQPKAIEALIGKCMTKTKGQLDPQITRKLMKIYLSDVIK
jgi:aspartyl-tRNA(Asn)/glutamyl-tRNA(Gln) amidotransferase subunit B